MPTATRTHATFISIPSVKRSLTAPNPKCQTNYNCNRSSGMMSPRICETTKRYSSPTVSLLNGLCFGSSVIEVSGLGDDLGCDDDCERERETCPFFFGARKVHMAMPTTNRGANARQSTRVVPSCFFCMYPSLLVIFS